ncbi:MAG TPA: ABC transporter ATP-binding protein, partial [Pseudomonadales bacterium]|nr:ABC transporter ATP-binding protein [Pseudomonadales bacterium]
MSEVLLQAQSISKCFGGVNALQNVSISIPAGAIYGLIGPNGAGKTTLFNVITGLYQADSGTILFGQQNILNIKPHLIVQAGIARTFQNIRLFGHMTALENVMVGRHIKSRAGVLGAVLNTAKVKAEELAVREKAFALLSYVGLASRANKVAKELSYGEQRRLEIARALATEPKLIALDEPAAGMNPSERLELSGLMQKINADGTTVL